MAVHRKAPTCIHCGLPTAVAHHRADPTFIGDTFEYWIPVMHTCSNPPQIVKVYDKADAPKGGVFMYQLIERNGTVDISVPSYEPLQAGERWAYFYSVKK